MALMDQALSITNTLKLNVNNTTATYMYTTKCITLVIDEWLVDVNGCFDIRRQSYVWGI